MLVTVQYTRHAGEVYWCDRAIVSNVDSAVSRIRTMSRMNGRWMYSGSAAAATWPSTPAHIVTDECLSASRSITIANTRDSPHYNQQRDRSSLYASRVLGS